MGSGPRGYLAFDLAPFPPAPVQGIETGHGEGVHHMGSGVTLRLTSPLSLPPPSRESRQGAGGVHHMGSGVTLRLTSPLSLPPPSRESRQAGGGEGGYITWGQGLPCVLPLPFPSCPRPGNRDGTEGGTSHGVRGYLAFDLAPFPPAPVQGIETGRDNLPTRPIHVREEEHAGILLLITDENQRETNLILTMHSTAGQ